MQTNESMTNNSRIKRSDEIGELAKALTLARSKIPAIEKDAEGQKGKQKYKYADLAAIYSAAIPHLSDAGIAHMQFPTYDDGRFIVTTMLVHGESGQWIESDCAFAYNADSEYAKDPKEQGLTITYIRRYAFIAAVGIIPGGDDDEAKLGNKQENGNGKRRPFEAAKAKGAEKPPDQPKNDPNIADPKQFWEMAKNEAAEHRDLSRDDAKVWLDTWLGNVEASGISETTIPQRQRFLAFLRGECESPVEQEQEQAA